MTVQQVAVVRILSVLAALALLAPAGAGAQSSDVPRLPDGKPDLQGVWDFSSVTPLQRPEALGNQEFLTDADAAELEARAANRVDTAPPAGNPGSYNRFWFDDGRTVTGTRRTSLIVDPPNGRLPSYTDRGRARMQARAEARERNAGPEDRDVDERCILGFNSGPPMIPGAYNNYMQLFQGADHVAILNEMVNDVRMIPTDGRPALASHIQQWRGASHGRWEGDKLVVETRNFRDIGTAHPAPNMELLEALGPEMHLVEKFSLADADTLLYEFTVTDLTGFNEPWSAELTMARSTNAVYEYACHEGNYGLYNILAGYRAAEAEEAGSR